MPSSLNISLFFQGILKRFLHVLVSVLVSCLVSLPLAGYCSEEIDVTSVTNVVFTEYSDFEDFRTNQINQAESLLDVIEDFESRIGDIYSDIHDATYEINSYLNYADLDPSYESYLRSAKRDADSANDAADSLWNDITAEKRSLETVVTTLESVSVPTYMIMVTSTNVYEQGSSGDEGGVGCSCPDYTSYLVSAIANLRAIEGLLRNVHGFVNDIWVYFQTFLGSLDLGITGTVDWESQTIGESGVTVVGQLVSNTWASASPQTLQSRITRYSRYINDEIPESGEPTPGDIANDVPLVAIVGLLYRIQHRMDIGTNSVDVLNEWREEDEQKEEDAKQDEEAATGNMESAIDDAEESKPEFSFRADFEFLSAYSSLRTALDKLRTILHSDNESDYLLVFDNDGMSVNLRGSGSSALVSRSGVIGIPSVRNSGTAQMWTALSGLFTCIWYILSALLGLYLTYWCVRVFVHGVGLAFAASSGNLGASSVLASKLASVMTGD